MRYRSKPVEIEAVQLPPRQGDFTNAPRWFLDALVEEGTTLKPGQIAWVGGVLAVATLEGIMWGKPGDYIIRGTEGELYPCKSSVFKRKYELAPRNRGNEDGPRIRPKLAI